MASFDAQIKLTADSTPVERSIRRIEKRLGDVTTATSKILAVDKQILTTRRQLIGLSGRAKTEATKRLQLLKLQRQELSLQKRETQALIKAQQGLGSTGSSSDGGDDGGSTAAGFALGSALKNAKAFRAEVAEISADLSKSTKFSGELSSAYADFDKAAEKISDNTARQVANQDKIADLTRRVAIQQGQVTRLSGKRTEEARKARQLLGETRNELKNTNASQRGLVTAAANYNDQLAEAERRLGSIKGRIDQTATAQAKANQNRRLPQAALAGAAFANIPGQDIAQAAGAGGLVAGPKGAAIAAAVATTLKLTTALANFGRQSTITAAEVSKLGIALRSVLGPDAAQGFAAINRAVEDFNQPLADATRQFTQLAASAQANGNTVAEVENLYRGLSSAVKATGGTTEDLSGVLRAATQVLSKGKVQAEELRGQIGDRLPGAFALFAEATGRTTAELDEALKNGEVRAEEFVTKFADLLREKYEPAAKLIGDSPEEAGARLEASLTKLQVSVGRILAPIGAAFQDTFTKIFDAITAASDALAKFLGIGLDNAISKTLRDLERVEGLIANNAGGQGGRRGEDNQRLTGRRNALLAELARLQAQKDAQQAAAGTTTRPPTATTTPDPFSGTDPTNPPSVDDPTKRIAALQQQAALERALLALEQAKSGLSDNQIANREIAIQLANDLLKANTNIEDSRERQATIDVLLLKNARDLAAIENARKKAFGSTIQDLEDQTALAKVLGDRKKAELQIEQDIRKLKQTGEIRDPGEEEEFRNAALGLLNANEQAQKLLDKTAELNQLWGGVGQTLINGVAQGFELAVSGVDNLGQAFQKLSGEILQAIGRALILKAISAGLGAAGGTDGVGIFSALAGTLTSRATGGPLLPGQPSIVGENGAELFIPGQAGQVVPTDVFDATRSAIASGQTSASDDAFAENAMALGNTTQILQERTRETQLAMLGSNADNITVDVNTIRVGSMDVVSQEQFAAGMKQTARTARAQVFSDLKNKPTARAGIGLG